jgi:hypothetical protein
VGDWALLPIIVIHFITAHYNDMGEVKLTALKMSFGAFASIDGGKRVPWEGRGDAV